MSATFTDDQILSVAEQIDAMPITRAVTGPRNGCHKVGQLVFQLPNRSRHPKIERTRDLGFVIWNVPVKYRGNHDDAISCAEALLQALAEIRESQQRDETRERRQQADRAARRVARITGEPQQTARQRGWL